MTSAVRKAIGWTEAGLVPDSVIRAGIRRLNRKRLHQLRSDHVGHVTRTRNAFVLAMDSAEIAPLPQRANEQHYEVPAEFFAQVLGRHAKYSCGYWGEGARTLDEAEAAALRITCENAEIADGMKILDLGCGWGSLSLWIAREFPASEVLAVSNSATQRRWIEGRAREMKLENVRVQTADMNQFSTEERFDRVVSVEMFEHMRNYRELFRRVAGWLRNDGKFFMHIFCHKNSAYEFVDEDPSDWMSRHFFAGGIMPSADLPLHFQQHLGIEFRSVWNGEHYAKTADAWLDNMDQSRTQIMPLFVDTYGAEQAEQWYQRWRIFFMAVSELFQHDHGQEWFVSHYRFHRQDRTAAATSDPETGWDLV